MEIMTPANVPRPKLKWRQQALARFQSQEELDTRFRKFAAIYGTTRPLCS